MRKFIKGLGKSDDMPDVYAVFVDTSKEKDERKILHPFKK